MSLNRNQRGKLRDRSESEDQVNVERSSAIAPGRTRETLLAGQKLLFHQRTVCAERRRSRRSARQSTERIAHKEEVCKGERFRKKASEGGMCWVFQRVVLKRECG